MQDLNTIFKPYEARPATRMAFEITADMCVVKADGESIYTATWGPITGHVNVVEFKAFVEPQVGDFIVSHTESENYHCAQQIFSDHHVIPELPKVVQYKRTIVCGRRGETPAHLQLMLQKEDHIRMDDTCDYCGSLDGDVLMERIEAGTIFLGGSDKNYKIYLKATEDGPPLSAIKFYYQHLDEQQKTRFVELWNERKILHSLYVVPYFMELHTEGPGSASGR